MEFWKDLWSFFFFLSLSIFVVLAIVVSIAGFFNIRTLFKNMASQHAEQ